MAKRQYTRRTDEDRIRELEEKVEALKSKMEARQRKDLPVVRQWPKVQRALRAFAQTAMDHEREDLAISVQAFMGGIERTLNPESEPTRRRGRSGARDDGEPF